MSETEHTPGSWMAFVAGDVICVHLEQDGPRHFTDVIAWPGFDSCDIKSHGEKIANANLIAAAPDLLDALTDARSAIESLSADALGEVRHPEQASDGEWGVMTWPIRDELLDKINRAIARARGEVM